MIIYNYIINIIKISFPRYNTLCLDKMVKLTQEIKAEIIYYMTNTENQSELSRKLRIPRSTIQSFWKKFRTSGISKWTTCQNHSKRTTKSINNVQTKSNEDRK